MNGQKLAKWSPVSRKKMRQINSLRVFHPRKPLPPRIKSEGVLLLGTGTLN
jgi:hypothetical protein